MLFDTETVGMMSAARFLPAAYIADAEHYIRERCEMVRAGLGRYPHIDRELRLLDPLLRSRYDLWLDRLVIERDAPEAGGWEMVGVYPLTETGHPQPVHEVIAMMRENDMQRWPSPEAYAQWKRERTAAVRERNERRGDDKILAAVDSLSRKQIKEFIEVERAIGTGEKIISHGADAKSLDFMRQTSAAATQQEIVNDERMAINPGMAIHRNQRKG